MAIGGTDTGIVLGDPVPWFGAPLIGDGAFNLQVAAGRWIVLSFLGSPNNPKAQLELTELLRDAQLFHEDRIVFYGVFTAPPATRPAIPRSAHPLFPSSLVSADDDVCRWPPPRLMSHFRGGASQTL